MTFSPDSVALGAEPPSDSKRDDCGRRSRTSHNRDLAGFLTVKTPLLPLSSGISMESAQYYGSNMEKPDLTNASQMRQDIPVSRKSHRPLLTWIAGISLVALFGIAAWNDVSEATRNVIAERLPAVRGKVAELQRRQTTQPSDTSNSTQDLIPFAYKPLPLGSIKPLGWLKDQMQGLADGLAGHEADFYPIVQDSYWVGGSTDYSPLNEGLPYWFNGLVPMAYGLDNKRLISQVQTALSEVLQRQNTTDGWLGPPGNKQSPDLWGRYPFMLGMTQMAEADSAWSNAIVASLYKFVPTLYKTLNDGVDPGEVWGRARYQDAILTMQWLYENHPKVNGTDYRPLLSNTMYRLKNHGIDWIGYYQPDTYFFQDIDTISPAVTSDNPYFAYLHGVNVGQGLKTPSVDYRFTHNDSLIQVQRNAIDWTLQYHGASSGVVIGDERESSLAPNRGSELCTTVETMFSMSYAYAVTGVNAYADHAERIAFNALPVMMTADNWAHQYIAQPNQPWAAPVDGGAVFWNVGNVGITFGLAPNYPCCAVNHPQGYPKFVSHMYMAAGDDGLAHVLLSPSNVTTTLGNGANVNVQAITAYPFSDILRYDITTDKAFTFYIRIPEWASSPAIDLNGNAIDIAPESNNLQAVSVPEGQSTIRYTLESALRVEPRANDTVAVFHGALLYALDVGYNATTTNANSQLKRNSADTPSQVREYNISNTMPWAYALDPTTLKYFSSNDSGQAGESVNSSMVSGYGSETSNSDPSSVSLPNPIWAYQAPAQYVTGYACPIDWPLLGDMPFRPPLANARNCTGKAVEVVMRPYGSLKVHMAELPTTSLGSVGVNSTS